MNSVFYSQISQVFECILNNIILIRFCFGLVIIFLNNFSDHRFQLGIGLGPGFTFEFLAIQKGHKSG